MSLVTLTLFLFTALINYSNALENQRIGINYGTVANNLPSPSKSIELIKSMNIGYVKIYDSNPEILKLLADTGIRVSIMVPNDQIPILGSNQTMADEWIVNNFLPYYPQTQIRIILVGNEIFSHYNPAQWSGLLKTMRFFKDSLKTRSIHNVRIGTPVAMDVLGLSFPPSKASFRNDVLPTIGSLLEFLSSANSFFFLDVYPYFPWSFDSVNIHLDFALLKGRRTYRDPGSGLLYTNLLDQMIDSVYFAMEKLGFRSLRIAISETGWPNGGDVDEPGANVYNAATYNRNLVRRMMSDPPIGTPARPKTAIPTFLFALYDENLKEGPGTERHWGLYRNTGEPVYAIDFTGANSTTYRKGLPAPDINEPHEREVWCAVARKTNVTAVAEAMRSACGGLQGACEEALAPGKECYEPVAVVWHASYAFGAHWARFKSSGAHCHFPGLSTKPNGPRHGTCRFPSVSA